MTRLLGDPTVRLVTLSGPGGIGKTRLALAAAESARARSGRRLVGRPRRRCATPTTCRRRSRRRPASPPRATARCWTWSRDRLAGRRALLVLDNAEHVLAAAPDLRFLLSRCPATQLLVTSRSLLRLRGEHDVPLGPLAVPAPGRAATWSRSPPPPPSSCSPSRARRADPSFAVTEESAPALAEVVRRLEGLPLAVELVAARVRTLPPSALLRRLDRALDLRGDADAPDRQRTLRDTIAWSHDLLAEPERTLLARLSVCAGGCTLDTAESIGAVDGDIDVLEALSTLVGHSLVASTDAGEGEPRFRMLELVRAFAAERLRERGEEQLVRERLARHLTTVSAEAGLGLNGPEHRLWRARLDAEATDLHEALRWAVATDRAELAVGLAAPLARWWWARGELVPMGEIAEATARLPSAAALEPGAAALLRWARGATRVAQGKFDDAAPLFVDLVADARERDDPWMLGHGLVGLAMTRPPDDPQLPGPLRRGVDGPAAQRRSLVDRLRARAARRRRAPRRRPAGGVAGARGGAGPGPVDRRRPPHGDAARPAGLRRAPRRRRAGGAGAAGRVGAPAPGGPRPGRAGLLPRRAGRAVPHPRRPARRRPAGRGRRGRPRRAGGDGLAAAAVAWPRSSTRWWPPPSARTTTGANGPRARRRARGRRSTRGWPSQPRRLRPGRPLTSRW